MSDERYDEALAAACYLVALGRERAVVEEVTRFASEHHQDTDRSKLTVGAVAEALVLVEKHQVAMADRIEAWRRYVTFMDPE